MCHRCCGMRPQQGQFAGTKLLAAIYMLLCCCLQQRESSVMCLMHVQRYPCSSSMDTVDCIPGWSAGPTGGGGRCLAAAALH